LLFKQIIKNEEALNCAGSFFVICIIKTGICSTFRLSLTLIILVFILAGEAPAVSVVKCDLVKDYNIDWKDLEVIAQHWLNTCGDCNGTDLDNSGTVNLVDFALFAPHWKTDPDLVYLWGFVEHQWTNTMYMLTHDSAYSTPDCNYPRSTNPTTGKWYTAGKQWASGYIPGALWYLYQRTSDQQWRSWAESWTAQLQDQQLRKNDHEAGSIIFRSFGLGYKITQNPAYKPVIFEACRSLLSLYDPNVGCIKSWNGHRDVVTQINYPYPVIVDGMMMLEILFWGVKNGGDPNWYSKAVSNADKVMANNIRPNGSSWQIVAYNPSNGAVVKRLNKQGININKPGIDNVETTWSRGQAWGIAGFTMAYRETLDPNYLNTAKKCANYFIDHLPPDYVPYWDFNAPDYPPSDPNSHLHRDSSAAAIAASGILELSTFVSGADKEKFQNAAINILSSLASPAYLADGTNRMGILLHGTGNGNPKFEGEVDTCLMYGDHFFIEALMRYEDMFY
jgi:chondroitin AC lyase